MVATLGFTFFFFAAFCLFEASSKHLHTENWAGGLKYKGFSKVRDHAKVVNDPKGQMGKVLEVFYPAKTGGSSGGFSFPAPLNFAEDKVCMSYYVMFERGWPFTPQGSLEKVGGKLPGLMGGRPNFDSGKWYQCSGGRKPENFDFGCFTSRFMWRDRGQGEIYAYIPENKGKCGGKHDFYCSGHGTSIGRGKFNFPTNQWYRITQEVKLNDIGKSNGHIKAWGGNNKNYGRPDINSVGIKVRAKYGDSKIRGYYFSTFFGGGSDIWGPPKDMHAWFSDITLTTSCQEVLGKGPRSSPPANPRPNPNPKPSPKPSRPPPRPSPQPSGGGGSCGGVRFKKAGKYYTQVVAPSQPSIDCNGKTFGCKKASFGRDIWECRPKNCGSQTIKLGSRSCGSTRANAEESDTAIEGGEATDSSENSDDGLKGYEIALIVVFSICAVGLVVLVIKAFRVFA